MNTHLPTSEEREEIKRLRQENYELRRANERAGTQDKPNIGIVLRLSRRQICLAELD
jgi:hypothetical protein